MKRECYPKSPEHRAKIAAALRGRKLGPYSAEHRRKISEALKHSARQRAASDAMRGVPRSEETRRKISETRKRLGLSFAPTEAAKRLHAKLGGEWKLEFTIHWVGRRGAFPVDIAHPIRKIAIECDGPSHDTAEQQRKDLLKDETMLARGWMVIRVRDEEISCS